MERWLVPRTAVLLVNYNSTSFSARCVRSIAEADGEFLIVIVDNGSAPEQYQQLADVPDLNVTIRSEKNLGFGKGNNLGMQWILENTDCDYIFVLNNDTEVEPDAINVLENFMDDNIETGAVSPRIMFSEDRRIYWYGGGSLNWKRGGARSWRFLKPFDGDLQSSDVTFMTGCAMFLRRSMVEEIGGFDPRFFMYCEDWELSSRIAKSTWSMMYEPQAVIYHEGHASVRNEKSKFRSPLMEKGATADFYVRNVVAGSLMVLKLSVPARQRLIGTIFLVGRWSKWILGFVRRRQWQTIRSVFDGIGLYREMKAEKDISYWPQNPEVSVQVRNFA